MPIEAKKLIDILRDILTDLNKLSDEQLQSLINKEAKFKYFDAAKTQEKGKKTSITEEKINEIVNFIKQCKSKEEAESYLNNKEQKLTVAKLQDIAKYIGVFLLSKKKPDIIKALVEMYPGARLQHEAIQRT